MFKKGDKVRYIGAAYAVDINLTLGEVYTVIEAYPYVVIILDDNRNFLSCLNYMFELVNESNTFEFQVGDIVEFGGLEGKVKKILDSTLKYPVNVVFKDESFRDDSWYFTLDGKLDERHFKPLLKLVSRPKKKEKRIVKTVVFYDVGLDKTFSVENSNFPHRIRVEIEKEIEVEV